MIYIIVLFLINIITLGIHISSNLDVGYNIISTILTSNFNIYDINKVGIN